MLKQWIIQQAHDAKYFMISALAFCMITFTPGFNNVAQADSYKPLSAGNGYVYCSGSSAKVGSKKDGWKLDGRRLENKNGKKLDCSEKLKDGDRCKCTSSGEKFHGGPNKKGGSIKDSIGGSKKGEIFPNSGKETCLSKNGSSLIVRDSTKSWKNCLTFKFSGKSSDSDDRNDKDKNEDKDRDDGNFKSCSKKCEKKCENKKHKDRIQRCERSCKKSCR